jgi:hypothetical protein
MLYKAKIDGDIGVKGCKMVGNREIYGYELTKTFFVDNSGWGNSGESALTFNSFLNEVKAGKYYGIKEAGQFQVYIGEYRKKAIGELKAEKIDNGILSSKKIKNNTRLTVYNNGDKTIRLHSTDIIQFKGDKIILNSGGWDTVTTRSRFNEFLPDYYSIIRSKGITYIFDKRDEQFLRYSDKIKGIKFFDGMELTI